MFYRKEFKEGPEVKGTQKKSRPVKQKQDKISETDAVEVDNTWQPVPTKADRARQLFDPKAEITHEAVVNKLAEIISTRGRKSTNRKEHVRSLQELLAISEEHKLGAGLSVKILFAIIAGLFELNAKINDFMEFSIWNK